MSLPEGFVLDQPTTNVPQGFVLDSPVQNLNQTAKATPFEKLPNLQAMDALRAQRRNIDYGISSIEGLSDSFRNFGRNLINAPADLINKIAGKPVVADYTGFTPEQVSKYIGLSAPLGSVQMGEKPNAIQQGINRFLANTISGLSDPNTLVQLPAVAGTGPVGLLGKGLIAAESGGQIPGQVQRQVQTASQGDVPGSVESYLNLLLNSFIVGGVMKSMAPEGVQPSGVVPSDIRPNTTVHDLSDALNQTDTIPPERQLVSPFESLKQAKLAQVERQFQQPQGTTFIARQTGEVAPSQDIGKAYDVQQIPVRKLLSQPSPTPEQVIGARLKELSEQLNQPRSYPPIISGVEDVTGQKGSLPVTKEQIKLRSGADLEDIGKSLGLIVRRWPDQTPMIGGTANFTDPKTGLTIERIPPGTSAETIQKLMADKVAGKPGRSLEDLRPAIRTMDNKIVVGDKGNVHNDIIEKNKIPANMIDRRMFVDQRTGEEISREVLATMGVPGEPTSVPGAHASGLAEIQEGVQNASSKSSTEGTISSQVRPGVDEETSLRQQGQTPTTQVEGQKGTTYVTTRGVSGEVSGTQQPLQEDLRLGDVGATSRFAQMRAAAEGSQRVIQQAAREEKANAPTSNVKPMYSGIPLPEFKEAKETAEKISKYFKGGVQNIMNRERSAQLLDAADNQAKIGGRKEGNRVKVALPDKVDRQAITFIAEASGSKAKLQEFQSKVGDKNSIAKAAIQRAIDQLPRLSPHADVLAQRLEQQRQLENSSGVDTDFINSYMKHAYESEDTGIMDIGPGGTGVSTSFLKPRTFPNYATAIAEGAKPKSLDAATLLESRVSAGQKLINKLEWSKQLKQLKTADGQPFATDMVKRKGAYTSPEGYEPVEVTPGVRIAVKKEYGDIMHALLGDSFVRRNPVGRALLQTQAGLKHGLLLFDSYHLFRMMRKELFLTGRVGYNKGLSLLEYDKPTIDRMVKTGEIDSKTAEWMNRNRPTAQLLLKNGLNVGKLSEALYAEVMRKELKVAGIDINLPGRFNRFVFDKLSRGAMMESALIEFERTKKNNPTWTDKQVAAHTAKQINVFFGNLSRQGLIKSQSARDVMQIAFLAPQWVESQAQSEFRGYKQLAQVPLDAVTKRQIKVGTSAKAMATGIAAYVIANQLVNVFTRGHPTWENKEEGRKLDAFIPDVTGKSAGFWMSPLGDVAEMTHDYIRYGRKGMGPLAATGQIIQNKLSPIARAKEVLRTGRDYAGNKLDETGRLKTAAGSLLPTPLPLAGIQSDIPGQGQRQAFSSLGLKLEPAGRREKIDSETKGKSLEDRVKAEKEYKKSLPPMTEESAGHAADVAVQGNIKRAEQIRDSFDKGTRGWLDSRGLRIPAFENTIRYQGTTIKLTDEETKSFMDKVQKYYGETINKLKNDPYFDKKSSEDRAEYFSIKMSLAKQKARQEIEKEIQSGSKNESNKKEGRRSVIFDYLK